MNAVLIFDCNDPDERERFHRASRADDLWFGIQSALDQIREHQKYGDQGSAEAANATIQTLRDGLSECLLSSGTSA